MSKGILVNTTRAKLASQIQLWGLIGPLVAFMTLFVILIKSPTYDIYLSLATITGVLVSWKWKVKGFCISIGFLLLFYLYQFSEITPDEHLWHIGMNISIVMGSFITALSLQEVENLLHPIQEFFHGEVKEDAKEKVAFNENVQEKELEKALLAAKDEINAYEYLVENIKAESLKNNLQREKLVEELLLKQNELSKKEILLLDVEKEIRALQEKHVEEMHVEKRNHEHALLHLNQEFERLKSEKVTKEESPLNDESIEELKNTNELLSRERGRLESLVFRLQVDLHQKSQELDNSPAIVAEMQALKQQKELLENTLKEAEYREQELDHKLYEKAKVIDEQLKSIQELKTACQNLTDEVKAKDEALIKAKSDEVSVKGDVFLSHKSKEELIFEFKKIQGRYQQLREQFEEKSEVLNITRKELFRTEECLLQHHLEKNEKELYGREAIDESTENYLALVIEDSHQKIKELQAEIEVLNSIISKLSK